LIFTTTGPTICSELSGQKFFHPDKILPANEAPRCKQTGYLHMIFLLIASRGVVFTLAPAFSGIACLPATGG
jgi:hypothetical protein